LSGRGLCDELITRPEESYRLCCVVVCDLETSRMGAPYIYDITNLRVNVHITEMLLHNLSQRHVSALSRAIFRLNTFFCEVNHTINNVMLLLSTRSRVTSTKFINLKLMNETVELKCYHNTRIKDIKEQGITNTEGEWRCQNRGFFFCITVLVSSLVIL